MYTYIYMYVYVYSNGWKGESKLLRHHPVELSQPNYCVVNMAVIIGGSIQHVFSLQINT